MKHTKETIEKIKKTILKKYPNGRTPYNKGKQRSEETKQKISKSKKGNTKPNKTSFKKGQVSPNKGKTLDWMLGEKNCNFGKFGKIHPKWVEEKKALFTKQIRSCFKYRQWRSDVFTRDNFTCQDCGLNKCYVEAHHIKEFAEILKEYAIKKLSEAFSCEELWNINNGVTLCKKCHEKYRKKKYIIN